MGTAVYSMNFFILSLIIYCVVATPISTVNNNRIAGGFDAYAGQFPYQAMVRFLDMQAICGGSIISNQWILTTAMCATATTTNKMRIVVGSIYLNSGGTTHTVLISISHPDFNETRLVNDIGLIRVNGQISYNDFVQPIELTSDAISIGLPLTVSGWGPTSSSAETLSNTLQYGILKSISVNECKNRYPEPEPLFDTQLCTDTDNRQGLCYDYGSPLVYKGQQHAVSSIPMSCGYPIPDIHTRVAPFRSWIKEITNV